MIKVEYDKAAFEKVDRMLKTLGRSLGKEILRKSVNDAARELHAKMTREIPKYVDRPKQITLRSLFVRFARGNNIDASIEFRSSAGKKVFSRHWLYNLVAGGPRRDKGLERALRAQGMLPEGYMAVPTRDIRTDAYGNVPGSYITQMLSYLRMDISGTQNRPSGRLNKRQTARQARRQKRFMLVPMGSKNNLSPGIYEYRLTAFGKGIRKAFNFVPVTYRPTFPYYEIAKEYAAKRLLVRMTERFNEAINAHV